jgi:hypothetical protein
MSVILIALLRNPNVVLRQSRRNEIADALEAAKRENERLRRQVEAAEALHGCCLDCYQPTCECNCCRATDQKGGE